MLGSNEPDRAVLPRRRLGHRRRRRARHRARRGRPRRRRRPGRCWSCAWAPHRPGAPPRVAIRERQVAAEQPWREWSATLKLPSVARDLVARSALTLRGLCHEPTGAILAAATTSLPEEIGGVRNWDYRYCWLRDAAMTAQGPGRPRLDRGGRGAAALDATDHRRAPTGTRSGCTRCTRWTATSSAPRRSSRRCPATPAPGRCGSATPPTGQVQLDVFGPVADLIATLADLRGRSATSECRAAWTTWSRPCRAPLARARPRHLGGPPAAAAPRLLQGDVLDDRRPGAARCCERHGREDRPELGRRCATTIAEDVLRAGLARGGRGVHASPTATTRWTRPSLWIGLSGLLADDDPRFLATVLAVEAELRSGPTVYRYRWDDGLPGARGRLPHLHRVADRGVPAHRPARRRRGAVRPDGRLRRPDRAAARSSTTR